MTLSSCVCQTMTRKLPDCRAFPLLKSKYTLCFCHSPDNLTQPNGIMEPLIDRKKKTACLMTAANDVIKHRGITHVEGLSSCKVCAL